MLSDDFALAREEDPAAPRDAARSAGVDRTPSAAEPVGIRGTPAPAPAAAGSGLVADPFVELGPGEAAMDRFASDYLQLLDGRLETIRRCLDDCDIEGARVAVLSLESSSAMLGGTALVARLAELRSHLVLGTTLQRNALFSLVQVAASDLRRDLRG